MSWLSEAHNEWHTVHGKYVVCPLDCGATEGLYDEDPSYAAEAWELQKQEQYGYSEWVPGMRIVP